MVKKKKGETLSPIARGKEGIAGKGSHNNWKNSALHGTRGERRKRRTKLFTLHHAFLERKKTGGRGVTAVSVQGGHRRRAGGG